MSEKVLITGITGQTGAFLANILTTQGHEVHGTSRSSLSGSWRLDHFKLTDKITGHQIGSEDAAEINKLAKIGFDKIFHLAAESSVASSLKSPSTTVKANILHTTYWLEAIRDNSPKTRFFNAASSEIFAASDDLLTENSHVFATNPYAVTKVAAMDMCRVFRDSFGLFIVNGILFNHESELRDSRFVTAKIVTAIRALAEDKTAPEVQLGNIAAERDFSYAGDFARGIASSLRYSEPRDYIFASGQLRRIEDFFNKAAQYFGFAPVWSGVGLEAVCKDQKTGRILATINEKFFRPIDEQGKAGDASLAKAMLGWEPQVEFSEIIARMGSFKR